MNIKNKIFLAYVMVFISILLLLFIYSTKKHNQDIVKNELFCRTVDDTPEKFKEGKVLFKSQCASCHKLNKKLVGPPLAEIKMDSISFYNYLQKHNPAFTQLSRENTDILLGYLKK